MTAPEISLIDVKLLASIAFVPSANRHRIELNANATKANVVSENVFKTKRKSGGQPLRRHKILLLMLCEYYRRNLEVKSDPTIFIRVIVVILPSLGEFRP